MIRRLLVVALVVAGVALLLAGPARGGIALSALTQNAVARAQQRYTPAESAELSRFACYAKAIADIPDGARARIHTGDDYHQQRMAEIAYPRLLLVTSSEAYGVYVGGKPDSRGVVVSRRACDDAHVTVVAYG